MSDKSQLLSQLKIDRQAQPVTRPRRWPWLAAAGALAVAAIAGAVMLGSAEKVVVRVAVAAPIPGNAARGASVLDASGYVVARRQATVSSKITGKVAEVLIEEGQRVEADQVLARIDDSNMRAQQDLARSQLEAARANLTEVEVQLAEAERQLKRNKELADKRVVSQSALDTAQANADQMRARLDSTRRGVTVAQRSLDLQTRNVEDTVVRAPFAGVITVKNAQPGEMISPLSAGGAGTRTGIGTLVDMDSLEIEVDVNENFINRVQPKQPVEAVLNAYPDWRIPAEVIAVVPTADRSKATVKVRIGFKERDPRVLPDMGVRVTFLGEAPPANAAAPAGVLVPAAALQESGDGKTVVYVVNGETLERRAVSVGARRPEGVQLAAGLSAGERVALVDEANRAKLADGVAVRIETGETP